MEEASLVVSASDTVPGILERLGEGYREGGQGKEGPGGAWNGSREGQ